MSETIILECKQANSKVTKNGDYETTLNRPITIEEGDEVMVKNSFIDTVASSSGNIVVAEDTHIEFTLGMYIIDFEIDAQRTYVSTGNHISPDHPDCQRYILCKKTNDPGGGGVDPDMEVIEGIEIKTINPTKGPVTAYYQYLDRSDNLFKGSVSGSLGTNETKEFPIGVIAKKDSFEVMNLPSLQKGDLTVTVEKAEAPKNTSRTYNIHGFDGAITIPKGDYSPPELARRLTEEFTRVRNTATLDVNDPTGSPFLQTTNGFTATDNFAFVSTDLDNPDIIEVTATDLLIGTTQAEVKFDDDTKRFSFNAIDMPLFANHGEPAVSFIKQGTTQEYNWASSSGGVFFTSIGPSSFWTDLLGFNLEDFVVQTRPHVATVFGSPTGGFTAAVPSVTLSPGGNVTEQFIGVADALNKDVTTSAQFIMPALAVDPATHNLTSTAGSGFTPIVAASSINQFETGYFLIDVDSKFSQQLVSSDYYSQSIQAIVSRFYTEGNFTSAGTEAAIPYVHRGANQMLTSLKIRILDPLTYDAPTVGENNTVFIQITKNPKSKQLY